MLSKEEREPVRRRYEEIGHCHINRFLLVSTYRFARAVFNKVKRLATRSGRPESLYLLDVTMPSAGIQ
jgi:hypothetical protein